MHLLRNRFVGFIVIYIGISIIVNIIGFGHFLLGPLFLFGLGLILYPHYRWIRIVFFVLALVALCGSLFSSDLGGVFIAALLIYFGYRMFANKGKCRRSERRHEREKRRREREERRHGKQTVKDDPLDDDWLDKEFEAFQQQHQQRKPRPDTEPEDEPTMETGEDPDITFRTPRFRNSLIGDLRLMDRTFELNDMNVSYGIGDVKIDLSKAIIPEGENAIAISGLIGDVDIYVPYDLDVSVTASVTLGDLEVLGYKQGGINRQINLATKGYKQSTRKVKISVSAFIGDIDVRYL